MTSPTKKTVWRSTSLKIISLLLGYTFWYIFGHSHTSTAWIMVPLYFYNIPKQTTINGPERVWLQIKGKRADLRLLDIEHLAIHINAEALSKGKHSLTFDEQSIFLPESIKLVHYYNPMVELLSTEHNQIMNEQDINNNE